MRPIVRYLILLILSFNVVACSTHMNDSSKNITKEVNSICKKYDDKNVLNTTDRNKIYDSIILMVSELKKVDSESQDYKNFISAYSTYAKGIKNSDTSKIKDAVTAINKLSKKLNITNCDTNLMRN